MLLFRLCFFVCKKFDMVSCFVQVHLGLAKFILGTTILKTGVVLHVALAKVDLPEAGFPDWISAWNRHQSWPADWLARFLVLSARSSLMGLPRILPLQAVCPHSELDALGHGLVQCLLSNAGLWYSLQLGLFKILNRAENSQSSLIKWDLEHHTHDVHGCVWKKTVCITRAASWIC